MSCVTHRRSRVTYTVQSADVVGTACSEEMILERVIELEIRIVNTQVLGLFSNETFGKRPITIIQEEKLIDSGLVRRAYSMRPLLHNSCIAPNSDWVAWNFWKETYNDGSRFWFLFLWPFCVSSFRGLEWISSSCLLLPLLHSSCTAPNSERVVSRMYEHEESAGVEGSGLIHLACSVLPLLHSSCTAPNSEWVVSHI